MVAKTQNQKRKSFGKAEGNTQSPKAGKVDSPQKTPGKGKGNVTPGKLAKSPKPGKSPQAHVAPKAPQQSPKNQAQVAEKKNNKRPSEAAAETQLSKKAKVEKTQTTPVAVKKNEPKKQAPQIKKGGQEIKHNKGQFFHLKQRILTGDKAAVEEIEAKIKAFEDRKDLTKTAKRKMRYLQRMKRALTGEKPEVKVVPTASKKKKKETQKNAKNQQKDGDKKQLKGKSEQQKKTETLKIDEDADSDESAEDSNDELEGSFLKTDESLEGEDSGESDEGGEEESDDEAGDEEEDEDDSNAEDDDDDEEEEEEEEEVKPQPKGKQNQPSQSPSSKDGKKTRYIVFVGNLPYDVTKPELSEHFAKAGQIRHIRIPTDIKTKKPRGFAYVEFDDEVTYQKALSMHHTFIKGRRINCLYTQGGKKKGEEQKNQVKVKNLKLQAMRKQGQLAGSVKENQKRSARRAKKNLKANGSN